MLTRMMGTDRETDGQTDRRTDGQTQVTTITLRPKRPRVKNDNDSDDNDDYNDDNVMMIMIITMIIIMTIRMIMVIIIMITVWWWYYPTLGCDIQGFRAMGLSVQYWPRWFQDFPAISLAVPFGANGAHLGICTLSEKIFFVCEMSCFWVK